MTVRTPTRRPRRTALAFGALALGASLVAAHPLTDPVASGYSYTFRMSTQTTDHKGKVKEDTPMIARVQVAGDRARIDIQETKGAGTSVGAKGGFMVADRRARTISVADPEEKTFTTMPIDAYTGAAAAMTAGMGQMMNIKVTDASFKTEQLGDGGVVNGMPTRKYRVTHDYKMEMRMAFIRQNTTNHTVAEYWVNEELKNHPNPLFEMMGAIAAGFMANDTVFSRQLNEAMKKMFDGVPVKSVTRTESVNQKGEKTVTVATMEMADFRRGDIPASVFAAPAGYTVKTVTEEDMRQAAAQQREGGRAQGAAPAVAGGEAADSAAKPDAKESAKDAAKRRLKGRLGLP